jgi:hypothetical protein
MFFRSSWNLELTAPKLNYVISSKYGLAVIFFSLNDELGLLSSKFSSISQVIPEILQGPCKMHRFLFCFCYNFKRERLFELLSNSLDFRQLFCVISGPNTADVKEASTIFDLGDYGGD